MVFIGFNGKPRSGKTLAVTGVSLVLAGSAGQLLTNYPIYVKNSRMITPYYLVKLLEQGRTQVTTVIALQEVYGWMDSYISMSRVNRFESYFVFQASKLGYHIIWDSQIAMRVDSSLRKMSDVRFEAKRKATGFRYTMLDPTYSDRDVPTTKGFGFSFEVASRFWNLYDTHKGLTPLGYDDMVTEMERLEPKLMNATIDRQVKVLLKVGKDYGLDRERGCSKIAVEDALMRLGESPVFAGYVSNRLRLVLRKKT